MAPRHLDTKLVVGLLALASVAVLTLPGRAAGAPAARLDPQYDVDGRLLLPEGFARWILAGSSLGLTYSEGEEGHEMYHFTLIEPSAYEHFRATGSFREGTMLALLLHGIGQGATPARQGRYAAEAHALEMAVKDSSRNEGAWAYYGFTGDQGLMPSARAMPRRSCQQCHDEHAAHDNVFLQFYPLLVDAAPAGVLPASLGGAFRVADTATTATAAASAAAASTTSVETGASVATGATGATATTGATEAASAARLALGGLDPVHLVEGRREMGKPEIVMEHGGFRYQFVSEPSRASFEHDPELYSIQNETCPVVPGAPIDPALFSVHEARIYAFATSGCVAEFAASPESFLPRD